MKQKNGIQTSLRMYRCYLCGRFVLFTDRIKHNQSGCKKYFLGPVNSVQEKESKSEEIKGIGSYIRKIQPQVLPFTVDIRTPKIPFNE